LHTTATRLVPGLALVLAAVACGDDPAPADPLASIPSTYARIQCGRVFECCNAAEQDDVLLFDPPPATRAECEAKYEEFYGGLLVELRAGIDAGRIVYDEGRADACFAKAESASCESFFSVDFLADDPDCDAAFQGKVEIGGACAGDFDCADPSASCQGASSGGLGACTSPPGEGEPCADGLCAEGLTCRFAPSGSTLQCLSPTPNGAECTFDSDCQSKYCDFTTGVCTATQPAGGPCATNSSCASGYCDTAAGACAPKKADGAACVTGVECVSGYCADASGAGACEAKKPSGAACTVAAECESGSCDAGACAATSDGPRCDGM